MVQLRENYLIEIYKGSVLQKTMEGKELLDNGETLESFFQNHQQFYYPMTLHLKKKNGLHPNGSQKYVTVEKLNSTSLLKNSSGLSGLQYPTASLAEEKGKLMLLDFKVEQLTNEKEKISSELEEERKALKEEKKARKKLEQELTEIRHNQEIEAMSGSSLNGVLENPLVTQLLAAGASLLTDKIKNKPQKIQAPPSEFSGLTDDQKEFAKYAVQLIKLNNHDIFDALAKIEAKALEELNQNKESNGAENTNNQENSN